MGHAQCGRGKLCVASTCKEVPCEGQADCAKDYTSSICWMEQGLCTGVECGPLTAATCPDGYDCTASLCIEKPPTCINSSQCNQPIEKCYKGQCKPVAYCEINGDCDSDFCDTSKKVCIQFQDVTVDDGGGTVEEIVADAGCTPEDFPKPTSYMCLPCQTKQDCGCGQGECLPLGPDAVCLIKCQDAKDCPSGYVCQDFVCLPTGGKCAGCVVPPGCGAASQTCDFKTGECTAKVNLCGPCTFDFQCGLGYRCWPDSAGTAFCAPECNKESFACPLASGCKIREDGALVCVPTGATCCYGVECNPCACTAPTPFCLEGGGCAQCLVNGDCPAGKPLCDQTTNECIISCQSPTPVYWKDPETGLEYCVECVTSKDCPDGMYCGTFKNKPDTYHKCYTE
jgi:hypothetical protein